jgi:hypothetical protein
MPQTNNQIYYADASWADFPLNTSSVANDLCTGIYEVRIAETNGCELVISPEVSGIVGLSSESNVENRIQLYPNPAKEKLTVNANKAIEAIRVLAITAREMNIDLNKIKVNLYELNTAELSSGTYIVMMKIEGIWSSSRIVVQ